MFRGIQLRLAHLSFPGPTACDREALAGGHRGGSLVGSRWAFMDIPGGPWIYGLYTSLIFSAIAMVALMRLEPRQMPAWLRELDRLAGKPQLSDLSLPLGRRESSSPGSSRRSPGNRSWSSPSGFPLVNLWLVRHLYGRRSSRSNRGNFRVALLGRQLPALASGYAMHAPHGPAGHIAPGRVGLVSRDPLFDASVNCQGRELIRGRHRGDRRETARTTLSEQDWLDQLERSLSESETGNEATLQRAQELERASTRSGARPRSGCANRVAGGPCRRLARRGTLAAACSFHGRVIEL